MHSTHMQLPACCHCRRRRAERGEPRVPATRPPRAGIAVRQTAFGGRSRWCAHTPGHEVRSAKIASVRKGRRAPKCNPSGGHPCPAARPSSHQQQNVACRASWAAERRHCALPLPFRSALACYCLLLYCAFPGQAPGLHFPCALVSKAGRRQSITAQHQTRTKSSTRSCVSVCSHGVCCLMIGTRPPRPRLNGTAASTLARGRGATTGCPPRLLERTAPVSVLYCSASRYVRGV